MNTNIYRTSIVLTSFGNVKSEANRLKTFLLLDTDLTGQGSAQDLCLLCQTQMFVSSLDDVCIQAGPYLKCTHSFLFSFYGILFTYIAILYQSV